MKVEAPGSDAVAYRDRGFVLLESMVSQDTLALLQEYLRLPSTRARRTDCRQVDGAVVLYRDPVFDALMAALSEPLGLMLGLRLAPTYSFVREYRAGTSLELHTDRRECEHSLTMFVDGEFLPPWPLRLRDLFGQETAIVTDPGAVLAYRGPELPHWREPCPSPRRTQAFLHYVDLDGPNAELALNGRPALGILADAQPPASRLQVEAFGARLVIEDETHRLADALRSRLPTAVSVRLGATGRGRIAGRFHAFDGTGGMVVERRGERVAFGATIDEISDELVARIELDLAVGAPNHTFVHAAVVGWNGVGIVIPGASGAGKSALVAELVRQGAVYYSDEYAVIDGRGRVHAYARPLPDRTDPAVLRRIAIDASGPRPPLPVAVIALVRYDPETSAWAPDVVTGARAALALLDHVLIAHDAPARALATVERLCRGTTVLEGTRPEAEISARSLLALTDEMLGDPRALSRRTAVRRSLRSGRVEATEADGNQRPGAGLRVARHVRFDDVLTTRQRNRLLRRVRERWSESDVSMVNAPDGIQTMLDHRRSETLQATLEDLRPLERAVRSILPFSRRELSVPWFPQAPLDVQVHGHGHGDYFRYHRDVHPADDDPRRLTCVYYFSDRPFRGGALHLYDEWTSVDGEIDISPTATVIEPVDNSLVVFPSEVWHEVQPILGVGGSEKGPVRYSVTVWVREDSTRPVATAEFS